LAHCHLEMFAQMSVRRRCNHAGCKSFAETVALSPAAALRKCVTTAGGGERFDAGSAQPTFVPPAMRQVSRTQYPATGDSNVVITYVDSQGGMVGGLSLQAGSLKMGDVIQFSASNTLNRTMLGGKDIQTFDYATNCGRYREAVREVVEGAVTRFVELGLLPHEALVDARNFVAPVWSDLFATLDSRGAADLLGPARTQLINLFWRCLDTAFKRATTKGWLLRREAGRLDPREFSQVETAFNLVLIPEALLVELPVFQSMKRKFDAMASRGSNHNGGRGGGSNGGRSGRGGGGRRGRGKGRGGDDALTNPAGGTTNKE
jgi:uncharacterized membrane protein YgcG